MMVVGPILRLALKIATIILYLLTFAAAYGGRVDPRVFPYFSWLTLFLPYFAGLTVLVVLGWLLAHKYVTAGLGIALIVFAWVPLTTAFPVHLPKEATQNGRTFTVMSYNILHGWDQEKKDNGWGVPGNRSLEYVMESGADVVCLQELVSFSSNETPNFDKKLKTEMRKIYPYAAGKIDASDLKVISKYPVKLIDSNQVYGVFEVTMPWGKLTVINVHLLSSHLSDQERGVVKELISVKNAKKGMAQIKGSIREKMNASFRVRAEHAEELAEVIRSIEGPLVLCGDFNDVPESWAYRTLIATGLRDAYADTGFGPRVTYNRYGFWFHLDNILYRPEFMEAISVKRGDLKSSDHYPQIAEFELLPQVK